jgi:hypothetical protein
MLRIVPRDSWVFASIVDIIAVVVFAAVMIWGLVAEVVCFAYLRGLKVDQGSAAFVFNAIIWGMILLVGIPAVGAFYRLIFAVLLGRTVRMKMKDLILSSSSQHSFITLFRFAFGEDSGASSRASVASSSAEPSSRSEE